MKILKFLASSVLIFLPLGTFNIAWSTELTIRSNHQQDPERISQASQETYDHEKKRYESSLAKIDKLENLFKFDPHILNPDNSELPDFSKIDISSIGNILGLYSDIPNIREEAVLKTINESLIHVLGTIADLSLTRSKSQFLKPLKCLEEYNVKNNSITLVGLQDIFTTPGSLASTRKCLEQIYQEGTVSKETLKGIELSKRLAGYFYDQQVIKFLNTTNKRILTSDLSSKHTKLAFLRLLQLQGELFSLLQPTTFNLDTKLPDSDLLKDIRHQLSHITQRKLENLLNTQLLQEALIDLQQLGFILNNIGITYPTFDVYSNISEFWREIKLIPDELKQRDESIKWWGLENLKKFFASKAIPTPELSGINFEEEIDFLLPKPKSSELLSIFLQLKKNTWDALTNIKDCSNTQKNLKAAFSQVNQKRANELESKYQQKAEFLFNVYDSQLKALREQQREIQNQQQIKLNEFTNSCELERQKLNKNQAKIQPKKVTSWFVSSESAKDFTNKVSAAIGNEDELPESVANCSIFYTEYKGLQDRFNEIKGQIETNSEISDIKGQTVYELLQLWFGDQVDFEVLSSQAEELKEKEEKRRNLRERLQYIFLYNFYKGGKKISFIYTEFIQILQSFGREIGDQEKTYNWESVPTPLENIFHKVYRVNINKKPITTFEDKKLFRSEKSKKMLGVVNELRELLNIETTVELEASKNSFRTYLSEKETLMREMLDVLTEIEYTSKPLFEQLLEKINSFDESECSSDSGLSNLKQLNRRTQIKYNSALDGLPNQIKEKFKKLELKDCWEMDPKDSVDYKNELGKHLTEIMIEMNNWTSNLDKIKDIKNAFWDLRKEIDALQKEEELMKLQKSSYDLIEDYIKFIYTDLKQNKIKEFQGLSNTARHKKYAVANEYVQKQKIRKNPRTYSQQKITSQLKDKWKENLTPEFYGCEYLLACFYETFKAINDFPEFLCLGNSREIRNKLFHFDPFKSEQTPVLFLLMAKQLREEHVGFVAKEAIMLSVSIKYFLESVIRELEGHNIVL